ncbi:MAG: amidohydrolase family protein [Methanomassiliicoccales archaeon]
MKAVSATMLYDGSGTPVTKNVYVLFEEERIKDITNQKPDCDIIAEGVVTPAFIDGHSHIGMVRSGEPSSEDESNERMSSMLPLVNAIDSIYMDDFAFEDSVQHGVLYSHVLPGSGNIVGGRTVLIRNFAKDVEEAQICQPGIKAALGYNPRSTTDWKGERAYTRMGALSILRNELIKARKAMELLALGKRLPAELEPQTEALMEIIQGKRVLMTHVHKEDDIVTLMSLMREFGFKTVIHHACDVHTPHLWAKVKKAGLDVIYGPMDSFSYKVELKHERWQNVKFLIDSGVRFGLMTDHPVMLQRNLFLQLRFVRRCGMSREEAISTITGRTADILGLEGLGRIAKGGYASLLVWNSDPFSLEAWPTTVIGEGKVLVGA